LPKPVIFIYFFQLKKKSIEKKSYIFESVQSMPKGYAEGLGKVVQMIIALDSTVKKMTELNGETS
jgi:hypothetical protein